jgi:glycosyltransferase involved in cell wall biosynthesis
MFTYYRIPDPTVSFRIVADQHIRALRRKGHVVLERSLWFTEESLNDIERDENSTALVHTLFYFANWINVDFDQIIKVLRQRHRSVYGFEVGDTDSISDRFVQWANHPGIEGIMLPSQFSIDSFRNSGVTAPLHKVPHGIQVEAADGTFDYLKQDSRPNILFFTGMQNHRKGLDLLMKVSSSFPGCNFIIKANPKNARLRFSSRKKNLTIVDEWLSSGALASLYQNCDVFLALHRGGAFELHCLEALAYGVPVLAPNHGAVLDYLNGQNATLISGRHERRFFATKNDHPGRNFRCDVKDVVSKLKTVLLNLDEFKPRSRAEGEKIRRDYSWDRIADLIVESTTSGR